MYQLTVLSWMKVFLWFLWQLFPLLSNSFSESRASPPSSTQQRLSLLLLSSVTLCDLIYLMALVIIYTLLSPKWYILLTFNLRMLAHFKPHQVQHVQNSSLMLNPDSLVQCFLLQIMALPSSWFLIPKTCE